MTTDREGLTMASHELLVVRTLTPTDYPRVMGVVGEWWGGRPMSARLSRVFFEHFSSTSYAIDRGDDLIAFLIGFMSQTVADEAYVHFIGVHPDYRCRGLASRLYMRFFETVSAQGRWVVRSSTSPSNGLSIAFHLALGFALEGGDGVVDGWPARVDYPLPGESRVFFVKRLRPGLREPCAPGSARAIDFADVFKLDRAG